MNVCENLILRYKKTNDTEILLIFGFCFLTDYQERTRKGQKDEKRTRDLFLFYMCLKELKRQ